MVKHINRSLSAGDWDLVIGNEFLQGIVSCMTSIHRVPFVLIGHLPASSHLYPSWPWPGLMHGAASDNMGFIDRAISALSSIVLKTFMYTFFLLTTDTLSEYCPTVSVSQVVTDVGLRIPTIIPSVIGFEYPRTISPMVQYAGAMVSNTQPHSQGNWRSGWGASPIGVLYTSAWGLRNWQNTL